MGGLTGYRRADGRFGVRNHVLVMPVRASACFAAARIAEGVDGAVTVVHQATGTEPEGDAARVRRTLTHFVAHPNVASALVVGVTDDDRWLADAAASDGQDTRFLSLVAAGGISSAVESGRVQLHELVARAAAQERVQMDASALVLGLECGGSDALSGITANPALGVASDLLVSAGGTSILAESPELIGAEQILARRAVSPEVAQGVLDTILGFEAAIRDLGIDVRGAQPSPGNQDGGLTTIEEKSLGAAKKGGDAPVTGVLAFAERPHTTGLHIMDTPGHDIEQMVGMVAGGAQIVAFTTGRGTPTGSAIAPCLKISTNTGAYRRLAGDVDIDAGVILDGLESVESMGRRIYDALLATAAGEPTSSEVRGQRDFAISRTRLGA
jgi:altronate dehydratase large subunit